MPAECSLKSMDFAHVDGCDGVVDFGGGVSDAGVLMPDATDRVRSGSGIPRSSA
jgi:hypothetical protein